MIRISFKLRDDLKNYQIQSIAVIKVDLERHHNPKVVVLLLLWHKKMRHGQN